jgi:hypothetical protein
MVSLSCTATREEGVTLVTGHVRNEGRPQRVRLANRLDGPVWPPRSSGVPAAGWDGDTLECVLAAGAVRAIGYATPAEPAAEPMTVATTDPADVDAESASGTATGARCEVPDVEASSSGVLRALGSPRPPRDAVPTPEVGQGDGASGTSEPPAQTDSAASPTARPDIDTVGQKFSQPTCVENRSCDGISARAANRSSRTSVRQYDEWRGGTDTPSDASTGADAVTAWFDAVEHRLAAGETLSTATRVDTATTAVERLGGLDGVRELEGELADEAARLRTVATRAETLADRAEAVELPVDTLERLA